MINEGGLDDNTIAALKDKAVYVPSWFGKDNLESQYNPKKHPVMNRSLYPDRVHNGKIEYVTRVTYDLQRLAVHRMTELMTGIPVKRIYNAENDRQKEIATYIERIMDRNRIDSVNIDRMNMLHASCEVMTLWYLVDQPTDTYGFQSKLKARCMNFSPMNGDTLYPLFDEYGDLVALSVEYKRKVGKKSVTYFDTYTAERHIKWRNEGNGWTVSENEQITVGKIPAVYTYRTTPIWEDTSNIVYEMEWAMSRNGNYLRRNSKPIFAIYADEAITTGDEKSANDEDRSIIQLPQGSNAGYITWEQATDNLKYHVSELRNSFFTQLQLPDWSYEKMSSQALSGESRKQLFIDAQMKVRDESGRWLEFFDREINVVKALLKLMLPDGYASDIDALGVDIEITPFSINDDKDTIDNLVAATGGKSILSRREAIKYLGWSDDVDRTMEQIREDETQDVFQPYE